MKRELITDNMSKALEWAWRSPVGYSALLQDPPGRNERNPITKFCGGVSKECYPSV